MKRVFLEVYSWDGYTIVGNGCRNVVELGSIKLVQPSHGKTKFLDDDGTYRQVYHTKLDRKTRNLSTIQLYNGLRPVFEAGCNHSFDCCGCYFGGVEDVKKRGKRVIITTRYARNI